MNEAVAAWLSAFVQNGDPSTKITIEMNEVGVAALVSYDPRVGLEEWVVARIYRAMASLAPRPKLKTQK